jgi:hypothetical protein
VERYVIRTFDKHEVVGWKKGKTVIKIKYPRSTSFTYPSALGKWLDELDSNGAYYVSKFYFTEGNHVEQKFWFTDEQDALMFKLKFG